MYHNLWSTLNRPSVLILNTIFLHWNYNFNEKENYGTWEFSWSKSELPIAGSATTRCKSCNVLRRPDISLGNLSVTMYLLVLVSSSSLCRRAKSGTRLNSQRHLFLKHFHMYKTSPSAHLSSISWNIDLFHLRFKTFDLWMSFAIK